jgi:hypothetical protein
MRQKFMAVLVLLVAIVAVGLASLAQDTPTEAPPGFDTPTLVQNPGSQSHSNGIAQPASDPYANDQKVYETTHDPSTGLGPVFNARACSDGHPLWGLRMRPRFMHDLRSLSLQNAIERHAGEAEHVRQRFQELSPVEKQQLFSFLNSL